MLKDLVVFNKNEVATAREGQMVLARIQARYVMAERHPRNLIKEVEPRIAELCSRKEFAEQAKYKVIVGGHYDDQGNWIRDYDIDLNIRAAEQLMVCYRNIFDEVNTVYEDDVLRRVAFEMTDLETGVTHRDEFTIYKTQERSKLKKDQEAIDTRINSKGEQVFIVKCTGEEVQKKQNAQVSRRMRKMFFRLFPIDLKIKARYYIDQTLVGAIKENIKDERAKITIAFSKYGVSGDDLEEYLGQKLTTINEKDIIGLREIFQSLEDGISRWSDYLIKEEPNKTIVNLNDIKINDEKESEEGEASKSAKTTPPKEPSTDGKDKSQTSPSFDSTDKTGAESSGSDKPQECEFHGPHEGGACPKCIEEMKNDGADVGGSDLSPPFSEICEFHGEEDCEVCKGEDPPIQDKEALRTKLKTSYSKLPPNQKHEVAKLFYPTRPQARKIVISAQNLDNLKRLDQLFIDQKLY